MSTPKVFEFFRLDPVFYPGEARDDDSVPCPRSGHRIVVYRDALYCLGGYNPKFWQVQNNEDTNYPLFKELWRFNVSSRRWTKLKTLGKMPIGLASHSACVYGECMLVFGGTGVPFGDTASNELHVCNLRTLEWRRLECDGALPIRSYGHAVTIVDGFLYVNGGTTGWEYNSAMHRLHLDSAQWEDMDLENDYFPLGRYRHEMGHYNNRLFVLGGGRSYECYKFEKVPVFNIEHRKWSMAQCHPDSPAGFPAGRRCHSCVQQKHDLYICGGYNGEEIYGDIWRLHLPTMQWTRLPYAMPQPAYFHSAALLPNGRMLTYGGVTRVDTERTSAVHAVWLCLPPLRELCWDYLTQIAPHLARVQRHLLVEAGVPTDLVARLS